MVIDFSKRRCEGIATYFGITWISDLSLERRPVSREERNRHKGLVLKLFECIQLFQNSSKTEKSYWNLALVSSLLNKLRLQLVTSRKRLSHVYIETAVILVNDCFCAWESLPVFLPFDLLVKSYK